MQYKDLTKLLISMRFFHTVTQNPLKEVKRLCKEFSFTAGMLKGVLAE